MNTCEPVHALLEALLCFAAFVVFAAVVMVASIAIAQRGIGRDIDDERGCE